MTLIEAARLALEALEQWTTPHWAGTGVDKANAAHTALSTAIEDAEKQEPVAWMVYTLDGQSVCVTDNPADFTESHRALPLYTTPPAAQRQPLTDEQISDIAINNPPIVHVFARAIEAAHGIGENK